MASDALYYALAQAESQPSKAYRAAQAGLEIPKQLVESYKYGADFGDSLRKRKTQRQTLEEVLGGNVPESLDGFKNTRIEALKEIADPLKSVASLQQAMEGDPIFLTEEQAKLTGGTFPAFSRVSPKRFIDAVRAFKTGQPKAVDTLKPKLDALENERKAIDARLRSIDANFGIGADQDEILSLKTRRNQLDGEIRKQAGLPAFSAPSVPQSQVPKIPAPSPVDDKVQVVGPDGKRYKLPRQQLQEAQQQGYRLVQ